MAVVRDLCFRKKPAIVIASEARIIEDRKDAELKIIGYKTFRCNSSSTQTGGVVIYVKESFNVINVNVSISSTTWIISLDIIGKKNTTIIGVYRSPDYSIAAVDEFLLTFNNHFDKFTKDESDIICVGDINLNVAVKTENVKKYINTFKALGLKQLIKEYTREDKKGPRTVIDHVLTNLNGVKYLINKEEKIADHHLIEIYIKNRRMLKKDVNKKFKCLGNFSKESFFDEFEKFHLSDREANIDEFLQAVTSSTNKFVVVKEIKNNDRRWFSDELRNLKRCKNESYVKFCISQNESDYDLFVIACEKYKKELRNAENKYIQKQIDDNRKDPKKLWKILKSLYKDEENLITSIEDEDKIVTEPKDIACVLNDFYVNSIEKIVNEIPRSSLSNYLENIVKPKSQLSLKL